ncbi:hypothetical protein Glove_413g24 [Diversispora epigaea]|uniref:Uncharacterized protein n=1 Tax=Diversispora epigaea TaxID=1348612 RepID=A0A397H1P7_9GLOM|nr:hypothetical protein Glove_413g24 [Diversispora epigaea]
MAHRIPDGLALNEEEQEAFHKMNRQERLGFNALPDNNAKLGFIRGLVLREKSEREKSDFEQKIIYGALYVSTLISLITLSATIYKNEEDKLKIFQVVLNSLIFFAEIAMVAITLWKGKLKHFYIFFIWIFIIVSVLLAILLPIFIKILPATITVFCVKVGIIVSQIIIKYFELKQ